MIADTRRLALGCFPRLVGERSCFSSPGMLTAISKDFRKLINRGALVNRSIMSVALLHVDKYHRRAIFISIDFPAGCLLPGGAGYGVDIEQADSRKLKKSGRNVENETDV